MAKTIGRSKQSKQSKSKNKKNYTHKKKYIKFDASKVHPASIILSK